MKLYLILSAKKYVLRFPEKEALEVNAFTLSWSNFFFHTFLPFALVFRVLEKIIHEKAVGILVVSDWPNQACFHQN